MNWTVAVAAIVGLGAGIMYGRTAFAPPRTTEWVDMHMTARGRCPRCEISFVDAEHERGTATRTGRWRCRSCGLHWEEP